MAENSEKKSFELDLSEIKSTKQVMTKDELVPEQTKGPVEPTGYIIRSNKNEEGIWVHTDLAELTSDEFVEWAKLVYPFHEELVADKFITRASKKRTIESIIRFHEESFLSGNRTNTKTRIH